MRRRNYETLGSEEHGARDGVSESMRGSFERNRNRIEKTKDFRFMALS